MRSGREGIAFVYRVKLLSMPEQYRLILKNIDAPGYTNDLECYLRHGGYEALKKALALAPKDLPDGKKVVAAGTIARGRQGFRPARPWRCGLLVRDLNGASSIAKAASPFTSSAMRMNRSPARSRTVRSFTRIRIS